MAVVSGRTSTLNPDAPLFIPAVFRQVEDFSPEWWELVKTSTWFRDFWLSQHQEEDSFISNSIDGDDEDDIANLLPDSFDLGVDEEEPSLEFQMQEFVGFMEDINESTKQSPKKGFATSEVLRNNLDLMKSPKEKGPKYVLEPAKYKEKPPQCVSPKCSPRRIQQPR
ncbi:hypothetical protein NE237_004652 [Protea cynaroides]|uniref:Ataxin-2 C-terminal domain-containing protein n=1 Tax=Protea cynaroides TaxID=273540 RepID=A0A9Q0KJ02_9MAGN|nr:hypothetical protein NE237_004652 [Protea cynaroides]